MDDKNSLSTSLLASNALFRRLEAARAQDILAQSREVNKVEQEIASECLAIASGLVDKLRHASELAGANTFTKSSKLIAQSLVLMLEEASVHNQVLYENASADLQNDPEQKISVANTQDAVHILKPAIDVAPLVMSPSLQPVQLNATTKPIAQVRLLAPVLDNLGKPLIEEPPREPLKISGPIFDENLKEWSAFLSKNLRAPQMNKDDPYESKLYVWSDRIRIAIKKISGLASHTAFPKISQRALMDSGFFNRKFIPKNPYTAAEYASKSLVYGKELESLRDAAVKFTSQGDLDQTKEDEDAALSSLSTQSTVSF